MKNKIDQFEDKLWHVGLLAVNTGVIEIGDKRGKRVCTLNAIDYSGRIAEMMDNANLIKAGPNLLNACIGVLRVFKEEYKHDFACIKVLQSAIKEARK